MDQLTGVTYSNVQLMRKNIPMSFHFDGLSPNRAYDVRPASSAVYSAPKDRSTEAALASRAALLVRGSFTTPNAPSGSYDDEQMDIAKALR